ARPERNPTHCRGTPANADGDREPATADEGDQCWRIDGPLDPFARDPRPARPDLDPPSIVEGREAPGRIVDPGPAPRWHKGPGPIALGRPARLHGRVPDVAVILAAIPIALARQIVDAWHVRGQVTRGLRDLLLLLVAPVVDVLRLSLG